MLTVNFEIGIQFLSRERWRRRGREREREEREKRKREREKRQRDIFSTFLSCTEVSPPGETVWRSVDPHARDHLQERTPGKGEQFQSDRGGGGRLWAAPASKEEEKHQADEWEPGGEGVGFFTSAETSRHWTFHDLLHVLLHTAPAQARLLNNQTNQTFSSYRTYLNIPAVHRVLHSVEKPYCYSSYWSHSWFSWNRGDNHIFTGF